MAKQASEVQDIGIFSDRSPRSKIQESKLQGELEKINQYLSRLEGELAELEVQRSRMIRLFAIGEAQGFTQTRLDECVRMIHDTRDNLEALKKERTKTEEAIAGLHPTPAQSHARSALQSEFTDLAKKRFEKTKRVQSLIEQLRQALNERIELAGKMREAADSLDCEIHGDVLDEAGCEDCLSALPSDLLTASERWHTTLLESAKH